MRSNTKNSKTSINNNYEHNDADSMNSDIISQEGDKNISYGSHSNSRANNNNNNNNSINNSINSNSHRSNSDPLPPEGNDPWSTDPWNDTGISWGETATAAAAASPGVVGPISTDYNQSIENSFESLQSLQFKTVPKSSTTTIDNNNNSIDPDIFGVAFKNTSATTAFNNSLDIDLDLDQNNTGSDDRYNSLPPTSSGSTKIKQKSISNQTKPSSSSIANNIIMRETKIGVVIQERLSILFDDTTKDPICKVVGSIYVKPTKRNINSFCLTVRDKRSHVEHWDEQNSRCRNITAGVPHLALDPGDQVFKISLTKNRGEHHQQDLGLEVPVVSYTCIPRLRPMPMLLKTKLHNRNNRCRLGIRIRANPQNSYVLTDIVLLIIVPLDVDGENVTMSRKGGVWDEMKRTIIWTIHKLDPGEIVDIQAQFKSNTQDGAGIKILSQNDLLSSIKFPVLARCNGDTNFSKIDMNSDYNEEGSNPVDLDMERSATILYRKV